MEFIQAQDKLNLLIDAHRSAAEKKYICHNTKKSWVYKASVTTFIPKKPAANTIDNKIIMKVKRHIYYQRKILAQINNTPNGGKSVPIPPD